MSCGFPIINFGNPGVHYETPCINLGYCILHDPSYSINSMHRIPAMLFSATEEIVRILWNMKAIPYETIVNYNVHKNPIFASV